MTSRKYLTCADTAKLLRQALKEAFHPIKFSVVSKSYSGGASITVKWTDGPNAAQVQAVTSAFEGAYFDGQIDYKGSVYHTLDGAPVHFGANFIFENREYSDALIGRAIALVCAKYAGEFDKVPTVADWRMGRLWNWHSVGGINLGDELSRYLNKLTTIVALGSSATLARVKFEGDDGYGAGTTGSASNGWQSSQGYPGVQS